MKERLKIYIAGPYSNSDHMEVMRNIRAGQELAKRVLDLGHSPFCPFIDYQLLFYGDWNTSVDQMYLYSLDFLEVCNVMLMLPSWQNSKGCIEEVKVAYKYDIPVYYLEQGHTMFGVDNLISRIEEEMGVS